VIVLLGIAEAQVLAVGCLPMAFLSMWCRTVAEAGCRFHRLVVECAGVADVRLRWRWRWLWVGVELVVWLFEGTLLPLPLLVKDVDSVLELCKSCPFSIDVLPPGFSTLSCYLPSGDSFLFLMEPFNLLFYSS
jgi:hypothetical protein